MAAAPARSRPSTTARAWPRRLEPRPNRAANRDGAGPARPGAPFPRRWRPAPLTRLGPRPSPPRAPAPRLRGRVVARRRRRHARRSAGCAGAADACPSAQRSPSIVNTPLGPPSLAWCKANSIVREDKGFRELQGAAAVHFGTHVSGAPTLAPSLDGLTDGERSPKKVA